MDKINKTKSECQCYCHSGLIYSNHIPSNCPKCHPKSECQCACHANKLNKPYEHESRCCKEMNGFIPKSGLGDWAREFDNIDFSEFSNEKDMMKFVMMSSEKVKSFISNLLSRQKEELIEKARGMKMNISEKVKAEGNYKYALNEVKKHEQSWNM